MANCFDPIRACFTCICSGAEVPNYSKKSPDPEASLPGVIGSCVHFKALLKLRAFCPLWKAHIFPNGYNSISDPYILPRMQC